MFETNADNLGLSLAHSSFHVVDTLVQERNIVVFGLNV